MQDTLLEQAFKLDPAGARQQALGIPWFLWSALAAVTSTLIGVHWDIAWHRSVGRDTFWTPPHMAIYLGGVLSGLSCGYLILSTTFRGSPDERGASVRVWGFRGPLGAFISAWGGMTMLASAPFDDWWHRAYGLDVKILSPPHVVLAIGILAVELGTLILILGQMNRAEGDARRKLSAMFHYVGGVMLCSLLVVWMERTDRVMMHSALFYRSVSLAAPPVLAAVAWASRVRWSSTIVASIYTALMLALLWILPLVPAQPKLGPVYQHVTHLIPPGFPLLLLVPAGALDVLWSKAQRWKIRILAPVAGMLFLATFVAVQWPFANFLISPLSRNYAFGTHYLDYNAPPSSFVARSLFIPVERTSVEFWTGMTWAGGAAILTTALGLACGSWMRRVQR